MPPCHPFRPVPGQCGPNRRGPLPAPPFDPRDYWATRKCVSKLFASLETKLDKVDVVDPGAATEAGKAADAKSTYEELSRILAKLVKKADKATTLAGYGITDAATKTEIAAKADLVDGKVPAAQLPSYVDDALEYDAMSAFPATGESGKIYVAKDTNLTYRWSGTQYVEISPSPVLDDTVTETSPNGVKSSGIWSWVTNLLTRKLDKSDVIKQSDVTDSTPDGKAADAKDMKAKLDDKRDETDLSVYDFKFRFDFGDSGIVSCNEPEWNEDGYWYAYATDGDGKDYGCYAWGEKERDSYSFDVIGEGPSGGKTFTGFRDVKYKTTDTFATTNGVNASITANEKTGTDKQIVRGALLDGGRYWDISVLQADTADFARELASEYWTEPAGVSGRPTTLAGYGITDGATKESIAPEYSVTSAYSVGAIVYRDGSIYQCKAAIAEGGEAWNAEHWELRKLDDFFTESNSLLTGTIDGRLPIPISAKSAGFTTESYKRFVVTVSGDMTVTLHMPTSEDAEIFECRFNGTGLEADASITFAGAMAITMDANCGTVTAGKFALMSAFWNGATWDINWKVGG